jgi:hypothetical protein
MGGLRARVLVVDDKVDGFDGYTAGALRTRFTQEAP